MERPAAQAEVYLRQGAGGGNALEEFIAALPAAIRQEVRERIAAGLRVRQMRRNQCTAISETPLADMSGLNRGRGLCSLYGFLTLIHWHVASAQRAERMQPKAEAARPMPSEWDWPKTGRCLLTGLRDLCGVLTWASARPARCGPGCHLAGLRPL